jgi:ABC-type Fe3+/spermidine/putrescine transport system ATPase subunit
LLLDEPLSSLDTGLRQTMREELVRIVRKANITVINVTHDQDEAMVMSDRILLLRNGTVQQVGAPEDLYHRPRSAFVGRFMGPANIIAGVIAETTENRATIRRESLALTGLLTGETQWQVREPGALFCRPEDVIVQETGPAIPTNTVQATVISAAFSGGRWRLRLAGAAGIELMAASDRGFDPGCEVWLTLPPERCSLVLPEQSEIRDVGVTSQSGDKTIATSLTGTSA